jgi:hypothetical protein
MIKAYTSIRSELPLFKKTFDENGKIIEQKQVYKGSEDYKLVLKILPGSNVKKELKPWLKKVNVRKDIIITELPNSSIFTTIGTNFFTKGDAAILTCPELYKVDKDVFFSSLKHEVGHVKNNDCFISSLVQVIFSTIAVIYVRDKMSSIFATIFGIGAGTLAGTLFCRYCEGKADDFGIAESSDEELKGGRRFLLSVKRFNLEVRDKLWWGKLLCTNAGDDWLDLDHPSMSSRIKKFKLALKQRNVTIIDDDENNKINTLKEFHKKRWPKLAKAIES